jgi:inorganic pyrophosphatase
MSKNSAKGINSLSAFDDETKELNVIIETPKGCRNKYKFDEQRELFMLSGMLPVGASFPFDFGFIPSTLGEDGDPLDILILMDEPAFVGCLISARLIGVIKAEQTEDGKTFRNDRLIGVASHSRTHTGIKSLNDLDKTLIGEIEHFFVSYNESKGKKFIPLGRLNVASAQKLIKDGIKKHLSKER